MGREHPAVGIANVNLAIIRSELGDLDASRRLYDEALAIFERSVGREHPYVAYALAGRGNLLLKECRHAEAEVPLSRALAILEEALGPWHVEVGRRLKELAKVSKGLGDDERAGELLRRARQIMGKTLGADHPEVVEEL